MPGPFDDGRWKGSGRPSSVLWPSLCQQWACLCLAHADPFSSVHKWKFLFYCNPSVAYQYHCHYNTALKLLAYFACRQYLPPPREPRTSPRILQEGIEVNLLRTRVPYDDPPFGPFLEIDLRL
ncbi:uncharacterized protein FOMMEDRAFT_150551 [Fomitiporia mediterranea MF3/22]|uniref:uncharacterized protein n=1 Tax=Fomitiporia mediterranea (strain MF3/22) TaxID=694068 RepID=UPI0004408889|nr:uncharacterized protein FOMMEDRAFT_150551 [Fomitiporia mediterranea MF3/22]EJD07945.1 hypothetical protein FOMMEDRAFT_150551 [Fomitiporia mediterranea MF3/22]